MLRRAFLTLTFVLSAVTLRPALAAELVMVEQKGCGYCMEWHAEIGPIYPKTAEGAFAPLRLLDLHDKTPADLTFARRVTYTPTFILVENGSELGRIEGYPGEDFFWGLLNMLLKAKTDFQDADPSGSQRQG